ncbi:MAG TPA: 50S ribosomal protein L15 [Candidatus Aenigmarchaeota archaeon]|nr:50S ribosomal protein L15 [Candidatus Aenigmarchaeota archaeon]
MGKKKTKKMRGKKTFGYGSKKKHRGGGSRGGRGMAGSFGHKKLKILKENPEHFGKRGFKRKNKKEVKAINLMELEKIASKLGKNKINVSELGYDKVLGKGKLTQPLEIEAKMFSEKAKVKIEEAGGKAVEIQ